MTTEKSLKNLASKMIQIMRDVEYVQKTGKNSFHKYSYATEADIAAAFSTAMKNSGVFMFSSITDRECITYKTAGNKDSFLVTVKLEVTFVDSDSGETFTSTFFGDGTDFGDKGIYKAITGAQKYALMKTFLLQTGDDPERDNTLTDKIKYNNEGNKIALLEELKKSALLGTGPLKDKWTSLSNIERAALKDNLAELKETAKISENKSSEIDLDLARGAGSSKSEEVAEEMAV
jgi:hypothetical protein